MEQLITKLSLEFALKDLGLLHYFLGIEVLHTPIGIILSQEKYAKDILTKTRMMEAWYLNTPMSVTTIENANGNDKIDPYEYRSVVRSLQ